jgi:hypothetical protein
MFTTCPNLFLRQLRRFHMGFVFLSAMAVTAAQEPTQDLNAAIEKHRKGVLVVEAAPGTEVVVEQQRHEFWFGAALASQAFGEGFRPEDRQKYLGLFLTNFNAAVTENALKWHVMEAPASASHSCASPKSAPAKRSRSNPSPGEAAPSACSSPWPLKPPSLSP